MFISLAARERSSGHTGKATAVIASKHTGDLLDRLMTVKVGATLITLLLQHTDLGAGDLLANTAFAARKRLSGHSGQATTLASSRPTRHLAVVGILVNKIMLSLLAVDVGTVDLRDKTMFIAFAANVIRLLQKRGSVDILAKP